MKKLYVSQSLIDVESRKELLDQAEIPCMVKNQRSAMLGGEVPFFEVFPELWVLNDEDFENAQTLLTDWEEAPPQETTGWTCTTCGETHQKEFTTCWKCGQDRKNDKKAEIIPLERNDNEPQNNSFWRYFSQGLILGIVLSGVGYSLWSYFSNDYFYRDRNKDREEDYIEMRKEGKLVSDQWDNNFDGIYETTCTYNPAGWVNKCLIDRNQDGEPDLIVDYTFGKLSSVELVDLDTGKVRKRAYYKLGVKVREKN